MHDTTKAYASIDFESYTIESSDNWTQLRLKNTTSLKAAFEAPSKKSTFTIREFNNIREKSLKKNALKWLTDYKSYGFTITHKRPLKLNERTYGFLIEALHKKSGKIFKQFMSINGETLVTLTCQSDRIDSEFTSCSDSMLEFTWNK